jgi:isopenicillin-N epimerase
MGTADPTAYLAFPAALDFFDALVPGGWIEVSRLNGELALAARRAIQAAFPPAPEIGTAPESMIGSMASIDLPSDVAPAVVPVAPDAPVDTTWPEDPLHAWLLAEHRIEVPVYAWPHTPTADVPRRRLLRISAQLYNDLPQYERLAAVLNSLR